MTTKLYINRKNITHKNNTHTKKQKGGVGVPVGSMFSKDPIWPLGNPGECTSLVTMPDYAPNLFGSQIASTDTFECVRTLAFYMYVKDIKRIISLQGCPTPYPGRGPNPPDNCGGHLPGLPGVVDLIHEENAWYGLKRLTDTTNQDPNITYINCQITDMTAGTLDTWDILNAFDFNDPAQRTLVHCFAGWGRTGTVFLFVLFKRHMMDREPAMASLQQPFLALANSNAMYIRLRGLLNTNIMLDDDPSNGVVVNALIALFDKDKIANEVFSISTITKANVLITRINYIIIYTAFGVLHDQEIVLYRTHPNYAGAPVPVRANLFIPVRAILTEVNIRATAAQYGFS